MPDRQTLQRVRQDRRAGKAPSTQAGEFIREEMDRIREGKHGARSSRQAIAIGLSKARRAGVELPPPAHGSQQIRRKAERDLERGHGAPPARRATAKRRRASTQALKREGRDAASHAALASQARTAADARTPAQRSTAAKQAARTKGAAERSAAARKGARSRGMGERGTGRGARRARHEARA